MRLHVIGFAKQMAVTCMYFIYSLIPMCDQGVRLVIVISSSFTLNYLSLLSPLHFSSQVMVRYRSLLLRTMYTLVFSVPLLLGFWEQKQLIELVLFESYYEPYGDGALSAVVFIQSHNVQIYSSTLTVDANFSGFTYVHILVRVPLQYWATLYE